MWCIVIMIVGACVDENANFIYFIYIFSALWEGIDRDKLMNENLDIPVWKIKVVALYTYLIRSVI